MRTERFKGALLATMVIASLITPLLFLSPSPVHAALTPHAPIYINGNAGFTIPDPVNGGGSGTVGDPYIIENWDTIGIYVIETTAYFIIRNCYIHDRDGIRFLRVANGKIENCTISYNDYCGIGIGSGILGSSDNTLDSSSNVITKCTISNNFGDGIGLNYVSNETIENCIIERNAQHGIALISSSSNTIKNCIIENNGSYGIYLRSVTFPSDHNRIYHNNFINNTNQAYDDSSNYWDDGYPSGGNYWSDYTGVDNYRGENQDILGGDGIGDTPHIIPGDNNRDRYPLMNPWPSIRIVVNLTISPSYVGGLPGGMLSYTVAITNMGNVVDNYDLSASDNSGWALDLSDNRFENVMSGGNRMATLSVIIPENAEQGAEDLITITVTSQADNTVSDNDSCIAHVQPWSGTSVFSLVNLYTVNVEKILDLIQGSKLVVKFYAYGDAFENENVIENFSTLPWHVEENEKARHPEGIGVKKARLDLTTDDTGNVISTIASYTVRRVDLEARFIEIPMYWAAAPPEGKVELEIEFMEIPMYWAGALS